MMKMIRTLLYIALISFCTVSCNVGGAKQNSVTGKVVRILDGDTYELLYDNSSTVRVRMNGIDAPEKGMPFAKKAREYLGNLCKEQMITIDISEKDRYGRVITFSYLEDGRELGAEMLKAGFAWHYKYYNSDVELAKLEDEARIAKRGLWKDKNPMAPWENRRLHRQGISTKGMYKITEETE